MKKSKLARNLQEAKRSKRRVLKENNSPKVAKLNNRLMKTVKDTGSTADLDALLTESSYGTVPVNSEPKYVVIYEWSDSDGKSEFDIAGPHEKVPGEGHIGHIKPVSREEAYDFMKEINKNVGPRPDSEKTRVVSVSTYNNMARNSEDFEEDWLITESKKAHGRFSKSKKKAIRGKRTLKESNQYMSTGNKVKVTKEDHEDFGKKGSIESPAKKYGSEFVNVLLDDGEVKRFNVCDLYDMSLKESKIHFGMSQNLFESINSYLLESDSPRSSFGSHDEEEDFVQEVLRFEEVLERFNGVGVNSDGSVDVDRSDGTIAGFKEKFEAASDSLSNLLEYLDI